MAETNADAELERARVIVDPPDGKIPYRPEAAKKQKENFDNRERRSGNKMLPARSAARHLSAVAFSDFPERPRSLHRLSGRTLISDRLLEGTHIMTGLGMRWAIHAATGRANAGSGVDELQRTTWLDAAGDYHSDQLHVLERYTRMSHDTHVRGHNRGSEGVHAAVDNPDAASAEGGSDSGG